MSVPFKVDLSDKIVAITGAGGVICSEFARALAECGAKVALLDINYDAAKKVADEIGENAYAVKCNCLDKADIFRAKNERTSETSFSSSGAIGSSSSTYSCQSSSSSSSLFCAEDACSSLHSAQISSPGSR